MHEQAIAPDGHEQPERTSADATRFRSHAEEIRAALDGTHPAVNVVPDPDDREHSVAVNRLAFDRSRGAR